MKSIFIKIAAALLVATWVGACSGDGHGSSDADGGDTDTDTDADTDADAGVDAGPVCTPDAYVACGPDGDVHSFDSCDAIGDVVDDCPDLYGTCEGGACGCEGNWDIAADCEACLAGWDIDDGCDSCVGNFSEASGCTVCATNWEGDACDTCPGNWDATQDCAVCENHWVDAGDDCGTCPGNWDAAADCDACETNWEGADCATCPANWDATQNCAVCANHWEGDACDTCPGNWDAAENCGDCQTNWEGANCETCPGNWDATANCAVCENQWTDDGDDCGTCPSNWDPAADCDACAFAWDGDACDECPAPANINACDASDIVDDGCIAAVDSEAGEGDAGVSLCDGLDNDCDGQVDEGCPCTTGQVQACFAGPPGRRGVGTCEDGNQTCEVEDGETEGVWGPCEGGIAPLAEACNEADDDCDGCADEDMCCHSWIDCSAVLDDATPFEDYALSGADFLIGSVPTTHWKWELSRGPCDEILDRTTFTMNGVATTMVEGTPAAAKNLTLHFTLSGDYTLKLTVTAASGETMSCSWVIHVVADGLRVELCWDTTGTTDLDLHLGKQGRTTAWFGTSNNHEDCFWYNCKTDDSSFPYDVAWGYASVGGSPNPRLDIDNQTTAGVPENINLDNPADGDQFHVMVHYYNSTATPDVVTHPIVNVYCGGTRKVTVGLTPQVEGFDSGYLQSSPSLGDGWKALDVTWVGGVASDACAVTPITDTDGNYDVETGASSVPYFAWP